MCRQIERSYRPQASADAALADAKTRRRFALVLRGFGSSPKWREELTRQGGSIQAAHPYGRFGRVTTYRIRTQGSPCMGSSHTDCTKKADCHEHYRLQLLCPHRRSSGGSEYTMQPRQATRVVLIGGARASITKVLVFHRAGHEAQHTIRST